MLFDDSVPPCVLCHSVGTGEALEVLLPSGAFCSLLAAGADATLHMWATSIVLSVGPVGPLAHALLSSEPLHSGPLPPSSSSDTSSSSPWASPSSPLGAEAAAWVFAVCVLQKDPLVRLQGLLGMGRLAASPSSCASQLVLRYLPILRECASGDPSTLNRLLVTRVLALACCDDAAAPTCALALANLTQVLACTLAYLLPGCYCCCCVCSVFGTRFQVGFSH